MMFITRFGTIEHSGVCGTNRLNAVQRALQWCETILQTSAWEIGTNGEQISIQRTVNGNMVELLPLEAAKLDLGLDASFARHHLPVLLNGERACVRSRRSPPRPLHTDMVASMMMLFGFVEFSPEAVPESLHGLLTNEQLASLPQRRRRSRTQPGQPSTSGRTFLSEARVFEHLTQNGSQIFAGQFERRDGTLRSIRARVVDWEFGREDVQDSVAQQPPLLYNPRDYHLLLVTDTDLGQYRLVATDRMTSLTVDGVHLETESAE